MKKVDFEFNWKFKDFEIRTTHTYGNNPEPYVELLQWDELDGRRYCFTLAYWHKDKDNCYELHFVDNRPLEYIADIDIAVVWKQLCLAQKMFEDAVEKTEDEYE